jgi:hypothetical protein
MLFEKGTTRLVLSFPKLGFVIKLPAVNFTNVWWGIIHTKRKGWRAGSEIWRISPMNTNSPFFAVIKGFIANWLEWYFWSKTRHSLLQPIWFSCFGLFNIQKYGKPLRYKNAQWLGMHLQVITQQTSHTHGRGHTLGHADNYTEVNGQLRLLDYGSKNVWPVILLYGERIAGLTVDECKYPPKKY